MKGTLFAAALLAGLLSTPAAAQHSTDEQWKAFNAAGEEISAKVKAGQLTKRQAALAALDKMRELNMDEPLLTEGFAHSAWVQGRVERGEINEDEARYLEAKKHRELLEQADAVDRAASTEKPAASPRPAPSAPVRLPRATTCRPDGLGGMRCQ